jgi:hypothetical protein
MKERFMLCALIALMTGCGGVDIGNSSKASEDDNSVDIDIAQNGEAAADCPSSLLWKPVSESDGKLVVLFPSEFDEEFESVSVMSAEGEIEQGIFAGFTNGDRQTWRFSKEGGEYTGVVEVQTESESCSVVVSDPAERND